MHLMGAPALTHKAEAELPAANAAAPPKANVMMAIEGANVGECQLRGVDMASWWREASARGPYASSHAQLFISSTPSYPPRPPAAPRPPARPPVCSLATRNRTRHRTTHHCHGLARCLSRAPPPAYPHPRPCYPTLVRRGRAHAVLGVHVREQPDGACAGPECEYRIALHTPRRAIPPPPTPLPLPLRVPLPHQSPNTHPRSAHPPHVSLASLADPIPR